ncbi:MAG: hypothetical protein QNJ09_02415 [Paracoccaceae bacterium]|nr:hypothetical protein [Paracoccaceae bacterium]
MAESAPKGREFCTVQVPRDVLEAAEKTFTARFGLTEQTLEISDVLQRMLNWVSERPGTWQCDHCHSDIASAADGAMQWRFNHATGVVDHIEIVHDRCARQSGTPSRPKLQVIGGSGPRSLPQEDTHKTWTVMPLTHLTDDDGLVQLLDFMLAERLPRDSALAILQRLHVRSFEAATPYLAKALQEKRFHHNLSEGLYWQGDLQEALRDAPTAPGVREPVTGAISSLGAQSLSTFIAASKVPNAEQLAKVGEALAMAGVRLSNAISRALLPAIGGDGRLSEDWTEPGKYMDALAQTIYSEALSTCPAVAGVLSEERESPEPCPGHEPAPFLVVLDPLDGSDNIAFGATVGTVFGVLPRRRVGIPLPEEYLRPASELALSGYMVLGQPLQLVIELAGSVAIFAFDPHAEAFTLRATDYKMPDNCGTVSVNEANAAYWDDGFQRAMAAVHARNSGGSRFFVSRFSGAMVADIHRIMMTGGFFAVPGDARRQDGKLRLVYECNPMSRIIAAAGGLAYNNQSRLDSQNAPAPTDVHQRSPFYAGSREVVLEVMSHVGRAK